MADVKRIFVAFAKEDEHQRDFLKGQSLNTKSPFEYVDFSVKSPYDKEWKDSVRTRILGVKGVIALVSKSTPGASGELWEIACAKEEKKPMIGLFAYTNDRTKPSALDGYKIIEWTWSGIAAFIDSV
jgi:hypothetical protein